MNMRRPKQLRVDEAATAVVLAVDAMDRAFRDALDAGEPVERLVAALALLDRPMTHKRPGASQRLASTLHDLRAKIGAQLGFNEERIVLGAGTIKRSMLNRTYGWNDGRLLAHKVALQAAEEVGFDRETGVASPPAVIAGAVADALIACGGLDNASATWRSDSLRARGIDPDEHREVRRPGSVSTRWVA